MSAPEYLECALLMLLIPLVSPQGWDYVLLLATPAVVCLVDRWRELTRLWQWGLGVALALMCLTMFDVMGRALYGQFMALSAGHRVRAGRRRRPGPCALARTRLTRAIFDANVARRHARELRDERRDVISRPDADWRSRARAIWWRVARRNCRENRRGRKRRRISVPTVLGRNAILRRSHSIWRF